jgi:hypothetical protein
MTRVVRPGGRVVMLDFTTPANHATGRVGSNSISWNRKMTGKAAKPGTYTLTLQASAGSLLAKAAERVKLRRG